MSSHPTSLRVSPFPAERPPCGVQLDSWSRGASWGSPCRPVWGLSTLAPRVPSSESRHAALVEKRCKGVFGESLPCCGCYIFFLEAEVVTAGF